MISRPQQILLKRAQAQAGIDDAEYRQALEMVSGIPGCRSSTDERLADRHVDNLLAYFETIYWNRVARAELVHVDDPRAVFRRPGYWANKNPKGNTSRDRHVSADLDGKIEELEGELMRDHGCGLGYFRVIQNNIQPFDKAKYVAALRRTAEAKRRKAAQPF
jgi:hypothetical protein